MNILLMYNKFERINSIKFNELFEYKFQMEEWRYSIFVLTLMNIR